MKGRNRKQGWLGHVLIVLASMVLITSWSLCGTYAKYVSGASGSSTARVAKFEVTESGKWDSENPVELKLDPETPVKYSVQITNKSEVAVRCLVSGDSQYNNLPLDFTMLDKDEKLLEQGDVIPAGNQEIHQYYLQVSWRGTDKDASYAGKTDLITITLQAVQED